MVDWKRYLPGTLLGGLAYGAGMVLGSALTAWLISQVTLDRISEASQVVRVLVGVLLAFAIAGLGAAIGGLLGGLTLNAGRAGWNRWSYAWRSGLSLGIPYGGLFYPIILVLAVMSFYNVSEMSPGQYGVSFALFGAILGALVGLLLGLLIVGRKRLGWVVLAGLIGFGLGGVPFGYGVWSYLFSISAGEIETGRPPGLVLGIFGFGALGGAALHFVFRWISGQPWEPKPLTRPAKRKRWGFVIGTIVLVVLIVLFRPVTSALVKMLTPQSANLSPTLSSNTLGTHWSPFTNLTPMATTEETIVQPEIAAGGEQVALAWTQGPSSGSTDVYLMVGDWDERTATTQWGEAIDVSGNPASASNAPQVAVDRGGKAHLVWVEAGDEPGVMYARCAGGSCTEPAQLSGSPAPACAEADGEPKAATIAVDDAGTAMVVWRTDAGALLYRSWTAGGTPSAGPSACVQEDAVAAGSPRLDGLAEGRFALTFQDESEGIWLAEYESGGWTLAAEPIGAGREPSVLVDVGGQAHVAWCGAERRVQHWGGGMTETIPSPSCLGRPDLAQDDAGRLHLIWYSEQAENLYGRLSSHQLVYESIRGPDVWMAPTIVGRPGRAAQPTVASGSGGELHMAGVGMQAALDLRASERGLYYASQVQYNCDGVERNRVVQQMLDVTLQGDYRPPADPVPYCQNRFDNITYMPNPDPAYSDRPPTENGGFDILADLVRSTQYEVQIATMWYDADQNMDSPGSVMAQAIADLYQSLKEDPARYPRGLTVRLLLGNPPELAVGEVSGQLWQALADLRNAGVPEMSNPELGWNLEVADFAGAFPHSHSKMVVVDGKTVNAAGFNFSYAHYPKEHPSGVGADRLDLGMQISGPVAQDALHAHDELWAGANRRHCVAFHPPYGVWQASCYDLKATSGHVPEVLRYDLPGGEATAFSMYRTQVRNEADRQIETALVSAQESIDVWQVNFTMPMICDLNILYDVCTHKDASSYLKALMTAAENGAKVRAIVYPKPVEGIENTLAIEILWNYLQTRDLGDQFEVRLYEDPMHVKAVLVDDEFLIIGSQNFHYSAFGDGASLTEYNLGTDDPDAIQEFKRYFEYYWEIAIPLER